jgi:SAM-dependent methyltransferase
MSSPAAVDLLCPRHRERLDAAADGLTCPLGDTYAVVDGVPILLVGDDSPTHPVFGIALEAAGGTRLPEEVDTSEAVDPIVRRAISATCGHLYLGLEDRDFEYPIPELRLPDGGGRRFLEIGCHWGRWCVSAARKGYRTVGVDPSLEGVRAARRVAEALGIEADFLVADGRRLPFPDESFDAVFSYTLLQHFSQDDARATFREMGRVLSEDGVALVQVANRNGLRSFYNRSRAGFREAEGFDMRYWTPDELARTVADLIGPCSIEVDGFFSLNAQLSDVQLMPPRHRTVVYASEALRRASAVVPFLTRFADSIYVRARRRRSGHE